MERGSTIIIKKGTVDRLSWFFVCLLLFCFVLLVFLLWVMVSPLNSGLNILFFSCNKKFRVGEC